MRRLALIAVVAVAAVGGAVFALGASSPDAGGPYQVRAIFDDAAFVVSGEDVRIAGAPVGSIESTEVCVPHSKPCRAGTAYKAAVTLNIDKAGFVPFHTNAHCAIRPQSLIGEKFVDCSPGTSSAPALSRIKSGPGEGTYFLPVTNTSSPVDSDIVQNIYREPVRQQFALILNELGTALAARGSDLNAVIRRANPALRDTDKVLKILARENHQLAQLATDSRAVLGPLSQVRHQLADFVIQANRTSVASAARAADQARSIQLLPEFLRQLRPLMVDLGNLADKGTPLFKVLTTAGPSVAAQYEHLASFANATRSSLIALGASSVKQQPALLATIPLDHRLERLGTATLPTAKLLAKLTISLDKTGGFQQLMKVIFNTVAATNGLDKTGHYLRTEALVGGCSSYAKVQVPGCAATFSGSGVAADTAAAHQTPAARIARSVHVPDQQEATGTLTQLARYLIGGRN
ncbi:MAG: MlaD family protein [Solirubrobacteraceae bacterium]